MPLLAIQVSRVQRASVRRHTHSPDGCALFPRLVRYSRRSPTLHLSTRQRTSMVESRMLVVFPLYRSFTVEYASPDCAWSCVCVMPRMRRSSRRHILTAIIAPHT